MSLALMDMVMMMMHFGPVGLRFWKRMEPGLLADPGVEECAFESVKWTCFFRSEGAGALCAATSIVLLCATPEITPFNGAQWKSKIPV
jgi:hypothetical protein